MFIRFIPVIMVLFACIITLIISIFKEFEIIFSLKILVIVIILFYIIGNIVKILVRKILTMEVEVPNINYEEEERAAKENITAEKSGDDDFEG